MPKENNYESFNNALKEVMLHIQWNSIMEGFRMHPDEIFKLPTFMHHQYGQAQNIQEEATVA